MNKNDDKTSLPKKRSNRFVPLDEVPPPGLSQRAREVLALALCGLSLYGLLCLATFRGAAPDGAIPGGPMQNLGGAVGYYLAGGFAFTLGYAGWVPFLLLLAGAACLFLGRTLERLTIKLLGGVVFAAMLAILFAGSDGLALGSESTPWGAGGNFGRVASPKLDDAFGHTGRFLLVCFGALVAFLISTEWLFSQLVARTFTALEVLWRRVWRRPAAAAAGVIAVDLDEAEAAPARARRRVSSERKPAGAAADGDEAHPSQPADDDDELEPPSAATVAGAGEPEPKRARRRSRTPLQGEPEADALARAADEDGGTEDGEIGIHDPKVAKPASGPAEGAPGEKSVTIPANPPTARPAEPAAVTPPPVVVVKPKPKPKPKPKKPGQSTLPFDEYPFPPIELFQEALANDTTTTSDALDKGGQAIVNKLANFGIEAVVVAASIGPAVTQYELRLAESIRVNKVAGFESDLAAALKAVSVRVVAPIPGKDTIGIEVPNAERQKVYMRDLLENYGRSEDLAIPLYLGKDVAGNPIVEDLTKMPHLLIAGTTGSGKSVCINTILLSILMTRTPQQVKLILVDPKMVELQAYKKVPHLCCDVVTNMKKAPGVLQWAVDEMENRYALLSAAGVNHIRRYNRLGQQELAKILQREPDPERVQLPYVVIVIDEFADLMNVAQNEIEDLIQRLAQKSRAVGMHVILATQRPSSEVITGIIKANLPCQIAFKVNRRIDSRVILDANGAEKLLGFGDMLYMPPGGGALLRAQGTFVADDEMLAVVRFLEENGQEPQFTPSLVQTQSSSRPAVADRDERYREAVEIILGQQRGSATLLQRALAVGYTRATRLLELMEEDGIVGAFVGSKSREVLLTLEEWRAREEQREAADAEGAADGSDGDGNEADGSDLDGGGLDAGGGPAGALPGAESAVVAAAAGGTAPPFAIELAAESGDRSAEAENES